MRSREKIGVKPWPGAERDRDRACGDTARACWLCGRPPGRRMERHHPVPRSRGGRETVPVHPICHRAIHRHFSNAELQRAGADPERLRGHDELARFLSWIAGKHPDFHARTSGKPRRG